MAVPLRKRRYASKPFFAEYQMHDLEGQRMEREKGDKLGEG